MRTVIAAVFAAAVLGTAVAPVRSAPMAVQIAQGNSGATRNRALVVRVREFEATQRRYRGRAP